MLELKVCGNNHKVYVNPKKHQHRRKLCPKCRGKLTSPKKGWKPNLKWLENRLFQRLQRKQRKPKKPQPIELFPMESRRGWRPSMVKLRGDHRILSRIEVAAEAKSEVEQLIRKEKVEKESLVED